MYKCRKMPTLNPNKSYYRNLYSTQKSYRFDEKMLALMYGAKITREILRELYCRTGKYMYARKSRSNDAGMYDDDSVNNQRRSGLSLTCFFIRSSIVVYHWSKREIESYSFTASVNPSLLLSSRCSINVWKSIFSSVFFIYTDTFSIDFALFFRVVICF